MNNKNLQEAKELNSKARANMNSDGSSKVSMTHGTLDSGLTSGIGNSDVMKAKELNRQSRLNSSTNNK